MDLVLYHRWHCPFSKKVRDFIEAHQLKSHITYKELDEVNGAIEELVSLTGKQQVPCLVINQNPMLESDEIIAWLDQNLVSGQEPPRA